MNENNGKKKSLISSIMFLCCAASVITALGIGGNSIFSIKSMSATSYVTYESAVDEGYHTEIKSQVQSTISILQSEYDKAQAGEKTEEQAKKDAKEIVRVMRYRDDQSGYFWIDDTDYILVMHPILPEQEGNNRYDLEDQNGIMIIQEIMSVCKSADKGGYNEFYFTRSDGVTVAPKIAYSEIFEPWGWIVSTGNYIDEMDMAKANVRNELNREYSGVLLRSNVVFVAAIVAALAAAFFVGKRIVAPLKKIQGFAQKISEGNLTTDVDVRSRTEIGQTADALRVAQENMRGLLRGITEVSNGVNAALGTFDKAFYNMKESTTQVSGAVDSIAQNVTKQASSTDEANGSVVMMADQINQTSEEVASLDRNAEEMNRISERSMNTLKQLIEVNNKTRQSIIAMTEQTANTNKSVEQIHMAANLINEISDQTSLLALNASIEAARAGEAGRGFSVVADEIAKLASQSGDSVEEIGKTVVELQSNAERSVAVMQEINEAIELQVSSLTETQRIMEQLHQELANCFSSVHSIDTMTQEIDNQRADVTGSLSVLNDLAQDNASVAEETAAMSMELARMVDDSSQIVEDLEGKVETLIEDVNKFAL
ncbi:MAG: methyl-accepting chemotaxis protein [Lachnospiraceae bacterium]|nr:methyl-accepting chemotaxis protein [Lachnospiraceae bacterium]